MRPCFVFTAAADDKPATLSIYDEIGFWGVQAKDFVADLGKVTSKVLNVEINSPGGDVFAGLAIYNALKGSGKEIVVKVMGVAASAASLIAMAGDKIVMPKNTFMMVHNPWSFAMGNADELRETADTLDKIGGALEATYVAKTGQTPEKIKELLSKDTWLTADESLELGFATEVIDGIDAKAAFDMTRADLPAAVKAIYAAVKAEPPAKAEPTAEEIAAAAQAEQDTLAEAEQARLDAETAAANPVVDQINTLAKAAGLEAFAVVIALSCDTVAKAQERIASAREIVALCALAKRPDDAKSAIRENKSVADVRASLTKAMAEADEHTDGTQKPKSSDAKSVSSGVNTGSLWNSHNSQKKEGR